MKVNERKVHVFVGWSRTFVDQQLTDRRMTRTKLARALGVSRPYVTQLLNGDRPMTLRTLARLADALGLRLSLGLHRS